MKTGEVAIEQAFVDLILHRRFNLRTGWCSCPWASSTKRHEPPTFSGVERTMVDTVIVSTPGAILAWGRRNWVEGFDRAAAVPGLDATGFSADEGMAAAGQQAAGPASDPVSGLARMSAGA